MSSSEFHQPDPASPPYLDEFFAECDEHLALARQTLLALEPTASSVSADRHKLEELFRAFHSIKGLSAMVGLRAAEELAHHMESYLGALRQGRVLLGGKGFSILVEGVSHLEWIVEASRTHAEQPNPNYVIECLESLLPSADDPDTPTVSAGASASTDKLHPDQQAYVNQAIAAGRFAWWITFTPSPDLAQRNINVNTVRNELKNIGELVFSAPKVLEGGQIAFMFLVITTTNDTGSAGREAEGLSCGAYVPPPEVDAPATEVPQEAARHAAASSLASPTNVVRVGLGRLDELMRMVGDLVITRAKFEQNLKHMAAHIPPTQWRVLQENNGAFERQIRDLREGVMRARLVPIRDTFARMQFIVRDLTREFDKDVRVQISGGETEVDKFIVERVMDPLLHLVRNAVSHGIEPTAERVAVGKPAAAMLALRASAEGQSIKIEVEDNGRGIDRQRVFVRAVNLGLALETDDVDEMKVLDILCAPGFSTRDEVDRASGRGMGMNVVKSCVEELGGSLSLTTETGRGTRFTIRLPLTLSITEALIFDVGEQTFALPQNSVYEVFEFETGAVSTLENNEIVMRRGAALPLLRLSALFQLGSRSGSVGYALVVGEGRGAVGLVVDRLLGLHEIVARPLTDPLLRVAGIAGVTELGDGRIVLILDAQSAIRAATTKAREQGEAGLAAASWGDRHADQ